MAKSLKLSGPMMRRRTGFHANQARLKPFEKRQKLIAPHLPAQHGLPLLIDPMNLENVLGDVESDRGNLHLDGPFPLMVTESTILAHCDAAGSGAVHPINTRMIAGGTTLAVPQRPRSREPLFRYHVVVPSRYGIGPVNGSISRSDADPVP